MKKLCAIDVSVAPLRNCSWQLNIPLFNQVFPAWQDKFRDKKQLMPLKFQPIIDSKSILL